MEKSVVETAQAEFFRKRVYRCRPDSNHKLIIHIVILVFKVLNYYIPVFRRKDGGGLILNGSSFK